jgi:hypothetical protein
MTQACAALSQTFRDSALSSRHVGATAPRAGSQDELDAESTTAIGSVNTAFR